MALNLRCIKTASMLRNKKKCSNHLSLIWITEESSFIFHEDKWWHENLTDGWSNGQGQTVTMAFRQPPAIRIQRHKNNTQSNSIRILQAILTFLLIFLIFIFINRVEGDNNIYFIHLSIFYPFYRASLGLFFGFINWLFKSIINKS